VRSSKGELEEERQLLLEEAETPISLSMRPGSSLVVNSGQTSFVESTTFPPKLNNLEKHCLFYQCVISLELFLTWRMHG